MFFWVKELKSPTMDNTWIIKKEYTPEMIVLKLKCIFSEIDLVSFNEIR